MVCALCATPPPLQSTSFHQTCTRSLPLTLAGNPAVVDGAEHLADIARLLLVRGCSAVAGGRRGRWALGAGSEQHCAEQESCFTVPPICPDAPQRNKAEQGAHTPPATSPQAGRALVRFPSGWGIALACRGALWLPSHLVALVL